MNVSSRPAGVSGHAYNDNSVRQRSHGNYTSTGASKDEDVFHGDAERRRTSWKRIFLLIAAITIHNIPGSTLTLVQTASILHVHVSPPVEIFYNTCFIYLIPSSRDLQQYQYFSPAEGLAVGVGFGAIGRSKSATFESARNLAVGIGLQNFPEGLAVSLPLRGSGMSVWRSFM